MGSIQAQLQALWNRVDVAKLILDPQFIPTLSAVVGLLTRNLKPSGTERKRK